MKRSGSDGVAVIVPEDPSSRDSLAKDLTKLLQTKDVEVMEVLVEAVYVCVPAKTAQAKSGEAVVLLDSEGKRLFGAEVSFSSEKNFVEGMRKVLRKDGRLETRAKAARTKEVEEALEKLGAEDKDDREKAQKVLLEKFETCGVAVIAARAGAKDPEVKARTIEIIRRYFEQRSSDAPLPFGVVWEEVTEDPCPPCGMSSVPAKSRKFIRFIGESKDK